MFTRNQEQEQQPAKTSNEISAELEQQGAEQEQEQEQEEFQPVGTATYSPEDNKLRIVTDSRMDDETAQRVKDAGFRWAPRQRLWVAPMWTPSRADLLMELCGDIGDEDTSLVQRAEERAERFGDYSEKRKADADAAQKASDAISERFYMGQPLLVGHHSYKKAKRDQEKMHDGMRKAVTMWDRAAYWTERAAGALAHAKYKELPAVRARRIKGIESDKRKQERYIKEFRARMAAWSAPLTQEQAVFLAGNSSGLTLRHNGERVSPYCVLRDGTLGVEVVAPRIVAICEAGIAWAERWIAHYDMRLSYERAMLQESGGLKAEAFDLQPGGRVVAYGEWLTILRVNRKEGRIVSVTTQAPSSFSWQQRISVPFEKISQYQEPTAEAVAAAKAPPMVNYRTADCIELTKAEHAGLYRDYKGTRRAAGNDEHGPYRYRVAVRGGALKPVFLTDAKVVNPPPANGNALPKPAKAERPARLAKPAAPTEPNAQAEAVEAMRQQLKAGPAPVIVAPQLFPTPAALAARMVDEAGLQDGMRWLEPSAGTGVILQAVRAAGIEAEAVAVEINPGLCRVLRQRYGSVTEADFLEVDPASVANVDAVLANPPFAPNAADIKHILHARRFLKPGGVLVAICANGPRQREALQQLAEDSGGMWEDLPDGTFKDAGTNVRTALVVIRN